MTTWNRLVRFPSPTGNNDPLIGEPVDPSIDVGQVTRSGASFEVEVYSGKSVLDAGEKTGRKERVSRIFSPLAPGEVGTIRGIAMNYHSHAKQTGLTIPPNPRVFMKPCTSLANPYPSPSVLPLAGRAMNAADYESELVCVIGRSCKNVSEADALLYVLGWTACNDISSRTLQWSEVQWSRSKSFDSSCPLGPTIISTSLVSDPSKFHIRGLLNGKVVQEAPLSDMIFSVARLIAFLSESTTLPPGTLILTGTPAGVGFSADPPHFLLPGDEFSVELMPHVGTLTTIFVDEETESES